MKVTTAGRYALRALLDLALYGQAGPVLRQEITSRSEISGEYIAQLFRPLARAGLVRSVMGPGGGYQLARPAAQITVLEILQAVEGPLAAVHCVLNEGSQDSQGSQPCPRVETCAAHVLWARLTAVITTYLDSVTLAEVCALARQLESQPGAGCQDGLSIWMQALPAGPACPPEFAI
jgi:Rrf2 family transcriptional regulator, iron-sulfur cluster assembly transcription factor